ncbi:membrane protein [Geomicrobium sp. JCM 19037]|uniref:DUF368 domain-containing protein n=1 Tax=Geomicrobium sp. JCM 19037 TaxID=1460634 RepID=UPI00045F2AC2|nr:DUF368 domain-containing protein [Geomicrobium sp. JCM 19037]GAK04003.1 membrane protein [Geomicrobium sp. JCM 19037]
MNWRNTVKGMMMGVVETVPGVSSSTIAMLLGIYENVIHAIHTLTTNEYKRAIRFLLPIGVGILVGLGLTISVISYLLEHFPIPIGFLFIGLIVGMLPFIWRDGLASVRQQVYSFPQVMLMIGCILFLVMLNGVVGADARVMMELTFSDYVYLFIAGWFASTALVLPGMSGALILVILGVYETALLALTTFELPVVIAIGSGVVVGILIMGKVVRFILTRYRRTTYAAIFGLLSGSVFIVFPGLPVTVMEWVVSSCLFVGGSVFTFQVSSKKG